MILLPMMTQILVWTLYTCFILTNKKNANNMVTWTLEYISLGLAAYFLIIEVIKMIGFMR